MQNFFTLILFLISFHALIGQRATYTIQHSETKPTLDGIAEPEIWSNAQVINDFTTILPQFGKVPTHSSSVKMVAHPQGIALFFDCASPKVRADGSQRDNMGYADYVAVGFDTWNDDQNAFVFQVSASGQTSERQVSSNSNDQRYHSRWEAATRVQADGWTAEVWIPYTALRFPAGGEQHWGLQIWRYDRSTGETSTWSPQDPTIQDEVWQYGDLEGIGHIRQERRRSVTLFQQNEYEMSQDKFGQYGYERENGITSIGADARIGLNSATTLDVSCLPDVQKDISSDYLIAMTTTNEDFTHPGQHEARDVFAKSGTYLEYPIFFSDQTPGITLSQGEAVIGDYAQPNIVNRISFSTRTHKNVAVGINHVLWDRPEATVGISPFIVEQREVPRNPGNLEFTAEKALRNNSWVHTAQSITYFRGTNPSVRSAYTMQLRDKSNRYEIAGRLRGQLQKKATGDPTSAGDGYLSLGKVNGSWTWGTYWEIMPRTNSGILYQEGYFNNQPMQYQSISHLSKNNYRPVNSRFLNIQHRLSNMLRWNQESINDHRAIYTFSATDKRFNSWQASIFGSPLRSMQPLYFQSLRVYLYEDHPLGGSISWRSDQRRRYIFNINLFGNGNTDTQARQSLGASMTTTWVFNDQFRAEGQYYYSRTNNAHSVLNTIGNINDLIAVNDWRIQNGGMSLYYFPKPWLNIYVTGAVSANKTIHQDIFVVRSDGSTEPTSVPNAFFPYQSKDVRLQSGLEWNINNNSQWGFNWYFTHRYSNNSEPEDFEIKNKTLGFKTTFIMQLGRRA